MVPKGIGTNLRPRIRDFPPTTSPHGFKKDSRNATCWQGANSMGLDDYANTVREIERSGVVFSPSSAVAHYALGNLHNKVLSRQYKLALPDEKGLAAEISKTRKALLQQTQRIK